MRNRGEIAQIDGGEEKVADEKESEISLAELDEAGQISLQQSFRSKMLSMVGLEDAQEEAEDEFNYLSFNRNITKYTGPISVNEVLDIIPLSGIMSGKEIFLWSALPHLIFIY